MECIVIQRAVIRCSAIQFHVILHGIVWNSTTIHFPISTDGLSCISVYTCCQYGALLREQNTTSHLPSHFCDSGPESHDKPWTHECKRHRKLVQLTRVVINGTAVHIGPQNVLDLTYRHASRARTTRHGSIQGRNFNDKSRG